MLASGHASCDLRRRNPTRRPRHRIGARRRDRQRRPVDGEGCRRARRGAGRCGPPGDHIRPARPRRQRRHEAVLGASGGGGSGGRHRRRGRGGGGAGPLLRRGDRPVRGIPRRRDGRAGARTVPVRTPVPLRRPRAGSRSPLAHPGARRRGRSRGGRRPVPARGGRTSRRDDRAVPRDRRLRRRGAAGTVDRLRRDTRARAVHADRCHARRRRPGDDPLRSADLPVPQRGCRAPRGGDAARRADRLAGVGRSSTRCAGGDTDRGGVAPRTTSVTTPVATRTGGPS